MSPLALARAALGAPASLRDDGGRDAARTIGLVLLGALGAAFFGAVVGSWDTLPDRLDPQPLYAALKLPLVLLIPVLVLLPTLHRLHAASGGTWAEATREAALAVARVGLVLVALSPAVWIAWNVGLGWHDAAQLVTGAVLVALAVGLRGVHLGGTGTFGRAVAAGLLVLVLAQTTWMLRPFLGHGGPVRVFVEGGHELFLAPAFGVPTRPPVGAGPVSVI